MTTPTKPIDPQEYEGVFTNEAIDTIWVDGLRKIFRRNFWPDESPSEEEPLDGR